MKIFPAINPPVLQTSKFARSLQSWRQFGTRLTIAPDDYAQPVADHVKVFQLIIAWFR
jgi:hypothetical protein